MAATDALVDAAAALRDGVNALTFADPVHTCLLYTSDAADE